MCGIIGGRLDDRFRNNIKNWITKLKHRGEKQGYGFIHIVNNKITTDKCMTLNLIVKTIQGLPDGDVVVHFRKASIGKVELTNAHPVISNDNTTEVIHNGTNSAYANFFDATSDSQGLASMLSEFNVDRHAELLNSLGVVFYTKNGKVMFFKDSNRPLVMSGNVFASEPLFDGSWANIKNEVKPIDVTSSLIGSLNTDTSTNIVLSKLPARYCSVCKKTHLSTGDRCAVCVVQGRKMVHTTTNKVRYLLKADTEYKVDSNCIVKTDGSNDVYTLLNVDKPTTIRLPYRANIFTTTIRQYLHIGGGVYVHIDVIKFLKLNNLPVGTANMCAKCTGVPVKSYGKWTKCFSCNTTTYVH